MEEESKDSLLEFLLKQKDTETFRSVAQWWKAHQDIEWKFPFAGDCALVAGSTFESLSFVFASCYQCAVKALVHVGDPDNKMIRAICATEGSGPFHPRKIDTTIRFCEKERKWILNGNKAFVTLGTEAHQYVVLAKEYKSIEEGDHHNFKAVLVGKEQKGVSVSLLPALPFLCEVEHAKVNFENVIIENSNILQGDGFLDYIKPFRTVEDCLIISGVVGHLIQQMRTHKDWKQQETMEKAILLALSLRELCEMDPSKAATHRVLAAVFVVVNEIIHSIESVWDKNEESYKSWTRDKKILSIAKRSRDLRLQKARASL